MYKSMEISLTNRVACQIVKSFSAPRIAMYKADACLWKYWMISFKKVQDMDVPFQYKTQTDYH